MTDERFNTQRRRLGFSGHLLLIKKKKSGTGNDKQNYRDELKGQLLNICHLETQLLPYDLQ